MATILTNHCCSLSSAVSSSLCCRSISPFLWSLSCCTVPAQVLGVLSMMHTAARADRQELLAQKALCRSRQERWYGANMRLLCISTNQLIVIKVHNIIRHQDVQKVQCSTNTCHTSNYESYTKSGTPHWTGTVEKCMISACCLRPKQNLSFSYKQNEHSALPAFSENRCKHYTFTYHTSKLCTAKLWPTMPYNYTHVDRPSLIHSTCLCTWPYDICIQFYRMLKVQRVCFICTEREKWYI